jgi:hypothetical protein
LNKDLYQTSRFLALRDCPKIATEDTPECLQEIKEMYKPPALKSKPFNHPSQLPTLILDDGIEPEIANDVENGFGHSNNENNKFNKHSRRAQSVHSFIPLELEEQPQLHLSVNDDLHHTRSASIDSDTDTVQLDVIRKPLLN